MKPFFIFISICVLSYSGFKGTTYIVQQITADITVEALTDDLYLDTTLLPDDFDKNMLVQLYKFLEAHVEPNIRTPFPDYINDLPVIVRYVPYTEEGYYPQTTEGFAGWCDVVIVSCNDILKGNCIASNLDDNTDSMLAFLTLIALPAEDIPDYDVQVWGITAHELAHTLGAIDGPRYPMYEDDKLIEPIYAVSDTYYWFGIASIFEKRWKGVVWDAWNDTCRDTICEELRTDIFNLEP